MTSPPRLSIGLPVYNGGPYLAQSLDALLGQTFDDFELIISDNASTDGTADVCRHYERDPRVRCVRQQKNIGAIPNHHFVFRQARGELFKWAAADDLYAPDLLERCIGALDERRDVVLAHSWTAAIDAEGRITQALEYPLATDSVWPPERFHSMLFGTGDDEGLIRADDWYGVIRSEVLRQVLPPGSYYHSDRTMMAAIALHGPFHQVPDWLYFRRDHGGRALHAYPTVRSWCANLDPRRADRLRHPTARLLAEYPLGYAAAIRRAPLTPAERRECFADLARWGLSRSRVAVRRKLAREPAPASAPQPAALISAAMVGARAGTRR